MLICIDAHTTCRYALTKPWNSILDNEKHLEDVRDTIASQADIIGRELGSIIRSPKKNLFVITQKDCLALLERTWNVKQMLKEQMNKAGIIPYRDFADSLKINLEKSKEAITIEANRKELEAVNEELLPLTLNIKELGVSVGIPLQHWEELLGGQDKLLIHLEKEDDGIRLSFEDGDGKKIEKFTYNIEVTLHDRLLKDPQKSSLVIKSGKSEINIGGHYDEGEKGVKAGVSRGGYIYPSENSVKYNDISLQDNETKEAIEALGNMGLIDSEGEVDKENFRPDDIITRAEFTSMLVKALSLREQIISVSGDNELKPTEGVKRSSAAVILNKMLNKLYQ